MLPQPPPLRVLLLGPRGSGKTVVGRQVASHLGVFHIAFRDYLQEQILPKMKRPPLVDEDEWEPAEEEDAKEAENEEQQEGEGQECRTNLHSTYMYTCTVHIHVHNTAINVHVHV